MIYVLVKIIQFVSFLAMLIVDGAVGMLIYHCIEGGDYTKEQLIFAFAIVICLIYVTYSCFVGGYYA